MGNTPKHCLCGSELVSGEAEVEVIPGVNMMLPGLFCSNHSGDCEFGFLIHSDVIVRAEELAKSCINKFN